MSTRVALRPLCIDTVNISCGMDEIGLSGAWRGVVSLCFQSLECMKGGRVKEPTVGSWNLEGRRKLVWMMPKKG